MSYDINTYSVLSSFSNDQWEASIRPRDCLSPLIGPHSPHPELDPDIGNDSFSLHQAVKSYIPGLRHTFGQDQAEIITQENWKRFIIF